MPTYDYQCDTCGHRFEAFQSMRDDALSICPACEQPALRRLITGGAGVIFRGSGFYVNDAKAKASKTDTTSSKDTAQSSTTEKSGGETKTSSGKDKSKKSA